MDIKRMLCTHPYIYFFPLSLCRMKRMPHRMQMIDFTLPHVLGYCPYSLSRYVLARFLLQPCYQWSVYILIPWFSYRLLCPRWWHSMSLKFFNFQIQKAHSTFTRSKFFSFHPKNTRNIFLAPSFRVYFCSLRVSLCPLYLFAPLPSSWMSSVNEFTLRPTSTGSSRANNRWTVGPFVPLALAKYSMQLNVTKKERWYTWPLV